MSENGQPKVVATFTFVLLDNNAIATDTKGSFPSMLLNLAMDVQKARMANGILQAEREGAEQAKKEQKRVLMADGSVPPPGL